MARLVHMRHSAVIYLGHSATVCGRVIYGAPRDMSGDVVTFGGSNGNIDATVKRDLADCPRCLARTPS